jgi:hypothetical protein
MMTEVIISVLFEAAHVERLSKRGQDGEDGVAVVVRLSFIFFSRVSSGPNTRVQHSHIASQCDQLPHIALRKAELIRQNGH